jgi:hypothetical protein
LQARQVVSTDGSGLFLGRLNPLPVDLLGFLAEPFLGVGRGDRVEVGLDGAEVFERFVNGDEAGSGVDDLQEESEAERRRKVDRAAQYGRLRGDVGAGKCGIDLHTGQE